MRRRGVLLALAAALVGGAAAPGPGDRAAIERVIRDQLAAFARDDGAAARRDLADRRLHASAPGRDWRLTA